VDANTTALANIDGTQLTVTGGLPDIPATAYHAQSSPHWSNRWPEFQAIPAKPPEHQYVKTRIGERADVAATSKFPLRTP